MTKAPRLHLDIAVAMAFAVTLIVVGGRSVNPDGVAYLELAEAIPRGRWDWVIQGYWSPGLPLLLSPLFVLQDRSEVAIAAHVLQGCLSVTALLLSIVVVRRHLQPVYQRAAWWLCAWIILRWTAPILITPDLLVCVAILTVLALPRDRPWTTGLFLGMAYLIKTSILSSLILGAGVLVAMGRRPRWTAVFGAVVPIAAWIAAMSLREGRPTVSAVGRLSVQWYLGDESRRVPDTDRRNHSALRTIAGPNGNAIKVYDFSTSGRTYLPWSDPESWAAGVPAEDAPKLTLSQATQTWADNGQIALATLGPLSLALIALGMGGGPPVPSVNRKTLDPLFLAGVGATIPFLLVHVEPRLLAPAALILTIGAFRSRLTRPRPYLPTVTGALIAAVIVNLAWYARSEVAIRQRLERSEQAVQRLFATPSAPAELGLVVFGPAVPLMGSAWLHRVSVVAQTQGLVDGTVPGTDWLARTFPRAQMAAVWRSRAGESPRLDLVAW